MSWRWPTGWHLTSDVSRMRRVNDRAVPLNWAVRRRHTGAQLVTWNRRGLSPEHYAPRGCETSLLVWAQGQQESEGPHSPALGTFWPPPPAPSPAGYKFTRFTRCPGGWTGVPVLDAAQSTGRESCLV